MNGALGETELKRGESITLKNQRFKDRDIFSAKKICPGGHGTDVAYSENK